MFGIVLAGLTKVYKRDKDNCTEQGFIPVFNLFLPESENQFIEYLKKQK